MGSSTGGGDILRVKSPQMWISTQRQNLSTVLGELVPRYPEAYPRGKIVVHRLCRGGGRALTLETNPVKKGKRKGKPSLSTTLSTTVIHTCGKVVTRGANVACNS